MRLQPRFGTVEVRIMDGQTTITDVAALAALLREAGLVEVRPEGKRRWYGLRAQPLSEVDAWLEPYRAHWTTRLDALERHLEENPE